MNAPKLKPIRGRVQKAVLGLQGTLVTLAATQYASEKSNVAFWLLIAAGAIQFSAQLFFGEEN